MVDVRCVAKSALCRCVTVTGYAKGPVAAGLAVVVSLEVLPSRHGAVREVVRVVAEDGIAEVVVTGEVNPELCNTRHTQRSFRLRSFVQRQESRQFFMLASLSGSFNDHHHPRQNL